MNPTWKAAIGVILIFILGWGGGTMVTLLVMHHRMVVVVRHDPEALAVLLTRQTTRNLGLNEEQKQQFHALILENLRERMKLQREILPQVRSLNGQTMQQINALLTADQQQKFQDNLLLFKSRYGRNPLNTGADEAATPTDGAPPGPATNGAAGSPPAR